MLNWTRFKKSIIKLKNIILINITTFSILFIDEK